jgi:hypothetical protein
LISEQIGDLECDEFICEPETLRNEITAWKVYHDEVEVLAREPLRERNDEDHGEAKSERGDEGD